MKVTGWKTVKITHFLDGHICERWLDDVNQTFCYGGVFGRGMRLMKDYFCNFQYSSLGFID